MAEAGRPAGVPRQLALLVAGAFFMEMLDGTIVATAAPSIARSFGVRSVDIGIAITAYLVTVAVFIPLSRWLADRIGARRLFFLAVLVFTVASALCAASTGLAGLAAAAAVLVCALLRADWPFAVVAAAVLLTGVFRSIGFTAYNTVALAEVDEGRMGHANTLHSALQQLAIGLGVAVGAVSLRLGEAVLGSGPADTGPYRVALVLIAVLILAGAATGLRMPRDAGELVRSGIAR